MPEKVKIPFVNYNEMNCDFYTMRETCELLNIDKGLLKETCMDLHVEPIQNEIGDYGFSKYHVRKIHNFLFKKYYDKNSTGKKDDPWA